jgi:DNA-binding NtrC family response regulator
VHAAIRKVSGTDANVLILGENGTGKELVARELHRQSSRAEKMLITVDMGSISETLFESELFGHVKGAFTDARQDRAGRFEAASGGTLFLDEIGNLPLNLQAKLLSALEKRQVVRLGTNKPISIDIRLISATNMPLQKMVGENKFRQDLLYRINTVEILLPPLRERLEDIPLLGEHFLRLYARKYKKPVTGFLPPTFEKLKRYTWPGNIRELQHAIERAIIMSDSVLLQPGDFMLSSGEADAESMVFERYNLEEAEKIIIRKAIDKHRGNMTEAAAELGLTRMSLYRRMKKYAL